MTKFNFSKKPKRIKVLRVRYSTYFSSADSELDPDPKSVTFFPYGSKIMFRIRIRIWIRDSNPDSNDFFSKSAQNKVVKDNFTKKQLRTFSEKKTAWQFRFFSINKLLQTKYKSEFFGCKNFLIYLVFCLFLCKFATNAFQLRIRIQDPDSNPDLGNLAT